MLGFSGYNYGHFSREPFHDLAQTSFSGPAPGERAPDFKATTLDGETIRLKSSWATHVFMTRTDSSHCFFGQVEHDLVRRPGGWQIARKKSILQNDYILSIMDIYCL